MPAVGFVGYRGMVGSVLFSRMQEEKDFAYFDPVFFSSSQSGKPAPLPQAPALQDAYDLQALKKMDIILTCQGGDYTKKVYAPLRESGWTGYWIDAASALRMDDASVIILDPVNRDLIDRSLAHGGKLFVGGNCTVSLMLMALQGLFKAQAVEWISSMTYQAASGAGAKNMRELVAQMRFLGEKAQAYLDNPASSILDLDRQVTTALHDPGFPQENFGVPLAASLIPWIDTELENGMSREEWKGMVETNKILGTKDIKVDGVCVRISSMRCHAQGLTIKLKKDYPLDELEDLIKSANQWVKLIPNHKEVTMKELSPAAVAGTLTVPLGRLRKMTLGPQYLAAYTVGDQLLWGAAEPLRRMLRIVLEQKF
ncbi:MAG: aspartate-semialdehyde dehydrogenase [Bacteriovoracaceae bacterium]|nr:aspartate-semialdehyde dehydrogenase [Bacteriovoracaceae bacterium]